jgi:hypothetical protein
MKSVSLGSKTHPLPFFTAFFILALSCGDVCVAQNATPQPAQKANAQEIFQRLDDYLKNNAIQFSTTYSAQNVALGSSRGIAHFFVERPNLLHIEFSGSGFSYLMTSDGKILTIYDEKTRKYAQRSAPAKPIEAVNLFTGLAAFQARVLQFLGLIGDVASGDTDLTVTKAGIERVGDLNCTRYEIRYTNGVDSDKWTAWLREDGVPLPCKSFIKSSDEGSQQTNLYNWSDKLSRTEAYSFTPPSGSREVDLSNLELRPMQ